MHKIDHELSVPWDRDNPGLGELKLYARELRRPDCPEHAPALLFLQGGPGSPAPRTFDGWITAALKHHRVILLDQRGTGRSTRLDRFADPALCDAKHLMLLQAPHIVADAEDLRRHLGVDRWDVLGQSFGGFCTLAYLSRHPQAIRYAYLTGGLPSMLGADEVYRATYASLRRRHDRFYEDNPWARRRLIELCDHLDNHDERLPTGERLSSRRLRTIGIELGRGAGFDTLAGLLEEPFHRVRGEKRLRGDTLAAIGSRVSFEPNPLYAVIHESIYGGLGGQAATDWSAHRLRAKCGFDEADPTYLTGEHIYPWLFDEDPALIGFKEAAEQLAAWDQWEPAYDAAGLAQADARVAAVVYRDDIFVPRELSLATAELLPDVRVIETAEYQHDGLRVDGAALFERLYKSVR
ncbi:alpha/beta fold hydrolase [Corynebacterium uterequi]|uniref:alpha/beta fold hydrolase n=1 Tax=Corynebacterium uterequi TaxID=1072256 RepID=UPI0038B2DF95